MKYESRVITYYDEKTKSYVKEISQDNVLTLDSTEYSVINLEDKET